MSQIIFSQDITDSKTKYNQDDYLRDLILADDLCYANKINESLSICAKILKKSLEEEQYLFTAIAYNTIGANYEELMEYEKALEQYEKSMFYAKKVKNDTLRIWSHINIGNIYSYKQKNYDKGIKEYNKANAISDEINDTIFRVITHINLAASHFKKNQYNAAIHSLDIVEKNIKNYDYPEMRCYMYLLMAWENEYLQDNSKANEYYLKSIEVANNNNIDSYLLEVYSSYVEFLARNKRFEEAYNYLNKKELLFESIYTHEQIQSANLMKMKIELDESQRQIDLIQQQKDSQMLTIKKSQVTIILCITILLILLISLYGMYRNNLFKKKMNASLAANNIALAEAKVIAEEASQLKSQFISTISHELRTPLYGVIGISNIISDEYPVLKNSPHFNSLKFSARYLLSLVNDLLQLSKMEEKKVELESHILNIADEINMVVNSLVFIANKNNNEFIVSIDDKIPEFLIGDKLRLSQIFMNLIGNALKFTYNGKISVIAKLVEQNKQKASIQFYIRDTGKGIPEDDLSKIFEKFVQIDRKENDYQGTGLGLAIVYNLVKLFGSDIQVSSQVGVGTEFSFKIDFDCNPETVQKFINNIPVDLSSERVYKILIVEDNKINQMVTRKILEKQNYNFKIVDDGYTAIELLEQEEFDMILMDINMPIINGFQTSKLIREKGITTPIIALTAFSKEEITEDVIESGMNDILIKPFEPIKLLQMIENLVIPTEKKNMINIYKQAAQ